MTGDWIQLLFSTLFGVLAIATVGPRAARRFARVLPFDALARDAFASADHRQSTLVSIAPLDSLRAPAPADARVPPRADVTRRRRSAPLPPPTFGPRPRVVVGT